MEGNTTMAAMPEAMGSSGWFSTNMLIALAAVLVGSASMWIVQFIQYRLSYKKLGPALKQPPFTILFGNLKAMASVYVNCPTDTHPSCSMTVMQRKFNLGNLWFMDNWPATSERQLVINDPVIAGELLQTQCIPKHPVLRQFVEHLCGKTSILFGPADATWKRNRALFNPGFSLGQLMTQIPTIIDDTMVFCDIMGEIADLGKIVQMEEPAARVTLDIMGHIVLDHDLNAQRTENELVTAFRSSIEWTPSAVSTNPFVGLHPLRPFMHRLYAWRMDNYIEKILDARYATGNRASSSKKGRRPAIDLALDEYALQQQESNVGEKSRGMDKHFKRVVMDQMKTFLFAGHDTSASTLCYTYYLLSIHPEALAKVRKEHDDVFGKGTTYKETGEMFKQDPTLANKLIFTLSVIKETLRLFPPASPAREGSAENSFTYDGVTYSTKDMMVFLPTHTLHRRADLFPSPDEFIPERFMPAPYNFQEVPKDAWRPFEKGLRACIGQELALLEIKIILAMTLRHFEVKAEYEEWDRMHGREKPGDILDGRRGICGERAYQVLLASAKPADGLPARVTRL